MIIEILEKSIAGLRNEKPDISYVLGMLETLVSMQRSSSPVNTIRPAPQSGPVGNAMPSKQIDPEAQRLSAEAVARMSNIKDFVTQSTKHE